MVVEIATSTVVDNNDSKIENEDEEDRLIQFFYLCGLYLVPPLATVLILDYRDPLSGFALICLILPYVVLSYVVMRMPKDVVDADSESKENHNQGDDRDDNGVHCESNEPFLVYKGCRPLESLEVMMPPSSCLPNLSQLPTKLDHRDWIQPAQASSSSQTTQTPGLPPPIHPFYTTAPSSTPSDKDLGGLIANKKQHGEDDFSSSPQEDDMSREDPEKDDSLSSSSPKEDDSFTLGLGLSPQEDQEYDVHGKSLRLISILFGPIYFCSFLVALMSSRSNSYRKNYRNTTQLQPNKKSSSNKSGKDLQPNKPSIITTCIKDWQPTKPPSYNNTDEDSFHSEGEDQSHPSSSSSPLFSSFETNEDWLNPEWDWSYLSYPYDAIDTFVRESYVENYANILLGIHSFFDMTSMDNEK